MSRETLGEFEHKVMLAILRLGGEAYSVSIVEELEERTDREVAQAAVFIVLRRLEEKGLLKDNPWKDEFQIIYYYLWHHEGRRARQGAMMGGPDYAHWHGFFELQQDLYKLEDIYEKRIETGEIE